jgi:hypothetical protein
MNPSETILFSNEKSVLFTPLDSFESFCSSPTHDQQGMNLNLESDSFPSWLYPNDYSTTSTTSSTLTHSSIDQSFSSSEVLALKRYKNTVAARKSRQVCFFFSVLKSKTLFHTLL